MCGIAGSVYLRNKKNKDQEKIIKRMQNSITHRGPDGSGFFSGDNVVLGMRRLAIVDITGGSQPFYNEDRNLILIGNGEIYNYKELREELLNKGHSFSSKNDMEVLIHLYEENGINFLSKLVGMYAFALYDKKRQRLFIVRDPFGEKPLYYTWCDNSFYFASELKAILKVPGLDKKIDQRSVAQYLYYNYVIDPATIFKNVRKISAGNYLEINTVSLKVKKTNYFNPETWSVKKTSILEQEILNKLKRSCELCLRSDVPVGISLSGGIDSSAIMALCAKKYKENLVAFSIGYEEKTENDESLFAREFSKKLGVKFIRKTLKTKEFIQNFPELVHWSDEPIADPAGFGIYSVSKVAKKYNVPVLIGGLGGDEFFWGYPWLKEMLSRKKDKLPMEGLNIYNRKESFKNFKNIFSFLAKKNTKKYFERIIRGKENQKEKANLIKTKARLGREGIRQITNKWLTGNCLALNDKLSMANSVELRSPLLDINLVRLALKSQGNLLGYRKEGTKYHFKKALNCILPRNVLARRKRGFTPPVYKWLKELIKNYFYLLNGGFLVKENIVNQRRIKLIGFLWPVLPFFWFSFYKLILLEIWGREYLWGENYKNIHPRSR
jgi:asparagine synthase (glutamine-hydrolysing)